MNFIKYFPGIAAGQGLEPRLTAPETAVLPLDDPAAMTTKYEIHSFVSERVKIVWYIPLDDPAMDRLYSIIQPISLPETAVLLGQARDQMEIYLHLSSESSSRKLCFSLDFSGKGSLIFYSKPCLLTGGTILPESS